MNVRFSPPTDWWFSDLEISKQYYKFDGEDHYIETQSARFDENGHGYLRPVAALPVETSCHIIDTYNANGKGISIRDKR